MQLGEQPELIVALERCQFRSLCFPSARPAAPGPIRFETVVVCRGTEPPVPSNAWAPSPPACSQGQTFVVACETPEMLAAAQQAVDLLAAPAGRA